MPRRDRHQTLGRAAIAVRDVPTGWKPSPAALLPALPEPLADFLAVRLRNGFADLPDQHVLAVFAVVRRHVGNQNIELSLRAIEPLKREMLGVRQPVYTRYQLGDAAGGRSFHRHLGQRGETIGVDDAIEKL